MTYLCDTRAEVLKLVCPTTEVILTEGWEVGEKVVFLTTTVLDGCQWIRSRKVQEVRRKHRGKRHYRVGNLDGDNPV